MALPDKKEPKSRTSPTVGFFKENTKDRASNDKDPRNYLVTKGNIDEQHAGEKEKGQLGGSVITLGKRTDV